MAIDIRATVTCSLGPLISASLSDDYLQGNGLIKCKGSCEIAAVITPQVGSPVTFTFLKSGITRTVPRKLRVLSSFADPFRRTTKVELGCKLTYLQDLQEPVNWKAFDDPANASYTAADTQIITIPIHASSIMDQCLTKLGITASGNPLSNKFSITNFDFSPGYVQVLSDLLVSESYCGYLDTNEVLQIVALSREDGTCPVIDQQKIIDLAPIGVGQLPGEAVTVSYSTLKLNNPDTTNRLWESEETVGPQTIAAVSDPYYYSVTGGVFNIPYTPRSVTLTTYDTLDRVIKRVTTNYSIAAALAPSFVQHRAGTNLPNAPAIATIPLQTKSTEEYRYKVSADTVATSGVLPDGYEEVEEEVRYTEEPYILMAASSPVYDAAATLSRYFGWGENGELFVSEKTVTRVETVFGSEGQQITKRVVSRYQAKGYTTAGQQALANMFNNSNNFPLYQEFGWVTPLLEDAIKLVYLGDEVTTSVGRFLGLQKRPSPADLINAGLGRTVESTAQLELAIGSATAQRRIEFTMPYTPDDTFTRNGLTYSAVSSDAEAKANLYGRIQNKLLMGNRNGANFQLAPEMLPDAPFAPFVVQAGGLSAMYRNNGTSWTMDNNGIVVSTDALFWGGIGGTGALWFPVAPGITTLPAGPAVIDGQMTVSGVVPVWNETMVINARVRTSLQVSFVNYSLETTQTVNALVVKTNLAVEKEEPVIIGANVVVPALALTIAVHAPVPPLATSMAVPGITVSVAAMTPVVRTDRVLPVPAVALQVAAMQPQIDANFVGVTVPSATVAVAALAPSGVGTPTTAVVIPTATVAIAANTPTIDLIPMGVVLCPAAAVNIAGQVPTVSTPIALVAPAASIAIRANVPLINAGPEVDIPAATIAVAAPTPHLVPPELIINPGGLTPVLGSTGAEPASPWVGLLTDFLDDGAFLFPLGFTFTLAGVDYTEAYVNTDGYISFGAQSNLNGGNSSNNLPRIVIFPDDWSARKIWYRPGIFTGSNIAYTTVRWEGRNGTSNLASNLFFEITFFQKMYTGTQYVEVRFGNLVSDGQGKVMSIRTGTSTIYASGFTAQNSSRVFEGDSTGNRWTISSPAHLIKS